MAATAAPRRSYGGLMVFVLIVLALVLGGYAWLRTGHTLAGGVAALLGNAPANPANSSQSAAQSSSTATSATGTEQAANVVGNAIGGVLGTDAKGKAGLANALNNLAQAGQQIEQHDNARQSPASTQSNGIPDAADTQTAVAATGGLLSALGGALGGSHRVNPVDFHTLESLLPTDLPGMQRGTPEGSSKQAMGIKGSSADVDYSGANSARIHINISDVSGVSGLIDLAGNLDATSESERASGYEKDIEIGGHNVHAKWENGARHGELQTIVAKRFEVQIDGDNVDMDALQQALARVDLARLESMKDANPQAQ